MPKYEDEWGNRLGWCNSCGAEGPLYGDCEDEDCDDGEMEPFEDDPEDF